jgi:hypothetical protein
MGSEVIRDISAIALAIVTLAVLATLVSRNANTSGVINSGSSAFNSALATAEGPVTGYSPGNPAYAGSSFTNPEDGAGSLTSINA